MLALLSIWLSGPPAIAAVQLPPFRLGIRSQVVGTNIKLKPRDSEDDALSLTLRPASSNYLGLTGGYRWLGGTYYFSVPASKEIRAEEGESKYLDYGFSLYFKRFGFEVGFNRFLGYLVDDSEKISAAARNNEKFFKITEMETVGYGGAAFYVLSDSNFLLAAAFDQSEVQTKSGGAWLASLTFRTQFITNAGRAFIPTEKRAQFGGDQDISYARFANLGVGIGYAYNWIWGDFYLSPYIGVAPAFQQILWRLENAGEFRRSGAAINGLVKFSLGFNLKTFFFTASSTFFQYGQSTTTIELNNQVWNTSGALGFRF